MSAPLLSFARWLVLLIAFGVLATACVRSEPPSGFTCAGQDDCEVGEKCSSGFCRAIGSCASGSDCDGSLQICENSRCVSVQCTAYDKSNCAGFGCTYGNVCRTTCAQDDECDYDAYCNQGQCIDGERPRPIDEPCSQNADCQSGVCCAKTAGKVCSQRCEPAGAPCTNAKDCQGNFCCAQFSSGAICSDTACLASSTCTADAQCDVDEYCANSNRCAPKLGKDGSCTGNRECLSGLCQMGKCYGKGTTDDACEQDDDCQSQLKCCAISADVRQCAPASQECLLRVGGACEFDSQCVDDDCYDLACTKPCKTSAECGVGSLGYPNACVDQGFGSGSLCYLGCATHEQCQQSLDYSDALCAFIGSVGHCEVY